MKLITITTAILLLRVQGIRAAGSGILHFVNLITPWGAGGYNNCCPEGQSLTCNSKCDVHINICISDISPVRTCIYGEGKYTVHVDEDTSEIIFGDMIGSLHNPFVYRFDVWKVGVLVNVDMTIGETIMNDSIRLNLQTKPEPNGQVVHIGPKQYNGHKTGITLEHSVSCDPFYYGDCTTLCFPEPNSYTCDRHGNKLCIPGVSCSFEISDNISDHKRVDGNGSNANISSEFFDNDVGSVYLEGHRAFSTERTVANTDYTESVTESRHSSNVNDKSSTENILTSSYQDYEQSTLEYDGDPTTTPPQDINESTLTISTVTSKQNGEPSTSPGIDRTTNLATEAYESRTSANNELTEEWSKTTVSETRTTKLSTSPVSEGTVPGRSIDITIINNSETDILSTESFDSTTVDEFRISEMSPNPLDISEGTPSEVSIETTSITDNFVSTTSPLTADVTTLTMQHECTGHVDVSRDPNGLFITQHATDTTVETASYLSSSEFSSTLEHDYSTSYSTQESTLSSSLTKVESSTSNYDAKSSPFVATDEITNENEVTNIQETTDSLIDLSTYTYRNSVGPKSTAPELASLPTMPQSYTLSSQKTVDSSSVVLGVSDLVSQQTTDGLSPDRTGTIVSVSSSEIPSTTEVTNTNIVTSSESLFVTSDPVPESISTSGVTPTALGMTNSPSITYSAETSPSHSVAASTDVSSTMESVEHSNEIPGNEMSSTPDLVISGTEMSYTPDSGISGNEMSSTPDSVISSSEMIFTPDSVISGGEMSSISDSVISVSEMSFTPDSVISGSEMSSTPDSVISGSEMTSTPDSVISGNEMTSTPDSVISGSEMSSTLDSVISGSEMSSTPDSVISGIKMTSTPDSVISGSEMTSTPDSVISGSEMTSTPDSVISGGEMSSTPDSVISSSEMSSTPDLVISGSERSSTPDSVISGSEMSSTPNSVISGIKMTSTPDSVISGSEMTSTPDSVISGSEMTSSPDSVISGGEMSSTPDSVISSSEMSSTPDLVISGSERSSTPDSVISGSEIRSTPDLVISGSEMSSSPDSVISGSEMGSTPDSVISGSEIRSTPDLVISVSEMSSTPDSVISGGSEMTSTPDSEISGSERSSTPDSVISGSEISSTSISVNSSNEVSSSPEPSVSVDQVSSTDESGLQASEITTILQVVDDHKSTTQPIAQVSVFGGQVTSTAHSANTNKESSSSTKEVTPFEQNVSSGFPSSDPIISTKQSSSEIITTQKPIVASEINSNIVPTREVTSKQQTISPTLTTGNTTENSARTEKFTNAIIESITPVNEETSTEMTTGSISTEISISPSAPENSGIPTTSTRTTDKQQTQNTQADELSSSSILTGTSSIRNVDVTTEKFTKDVPFTTINVSPSSHNITYPTHQEASTPSFTISSESPITPRPSSCTASVVYPGGGGEAILSIRIANDKQVVSVVALEKEVVEMLSENNYKVEVEDVKVIKSSFDGLTVVNITVDDDDVVLSVAVLKSVGDTLCKEVPMFFMKPPSPSHTEEDTDDSNDVLAGMLVLAAYLMTLFIVAVILVRRKYRERNKVSGRPMSEMSKVSAKTSELTERPETCMTGISSEYGETNC
ncbi:uncharacterized protein [Argopecten irradians]|uniref:uncharacterized protein n=1 Tax=Argopecten irradians TaxID=31199 RepID=UPI0037190B5F